MRSRKSRTQDTATSEEREPPGKAALFDQPCMADAITCGDPMNDYSLFLHQELHNHFCGVGNGGAGAEDGGNAGFVEEKRS